MTELSPGRPERSRAWIDWAVDLIVATFSLMAAVVLQREVAGGECRPGLAVAAVHGGVVVLRRRHPIPVLAVLVATAALREGTQAATPAMGSGWRSSIRI